MAEVKDIMERVHKHLDIKASDVLDAKVYEDYVSVILKAGQKHIIAFADLPEEKPTQPRKTTRQRKSSK